MLTTLLNRQSIDVEAQCHDWTVAAPHLCNDTGQSGAHRFDERRIAAAGERKSARVLNVGKSGYTQTLALGHDVRP